MKLNDLIKFLEQNHKFSHESWPVSNYIKKIDDKNFGIYNQNDSIVETVENLNSLPQDGWQCCSNKEKQNLIDMKIGRICQSFD